MGPVCFTRIALHPRRKKGAIGRPRKQANLLSKLRGGGDDDGKEEKVFTSPECGGGKGDVSRIGMGLSRKIQKQHGS